jgi:hypothetical protein
MKISVKIFFIIACSLLSNVSYAEQVCTNNSDCPSGKFCQYGSCESCTNEIPGGAVFSGYGSLGNCPWRCQSGSTTTGFYIADGNKCTKCPTGSYSQATVTNVNQSNCTVCGVGYYNTGTGNAACSLNCSDIKRNVASFKAGSWNAGNPTYCLINSCAPGWKLNESGDQCNVGNTYKIKFNTNGGTAQADKGGCTYGTVCSWTNTSTKKGATLTGWSYSSGEGVNVISQMPATWSAPPTIPSDNGSITLYAVWGICTNVGASHVATWDAGTCNIMACRPGYYLTNNTCVICDAGSYCPGVADDAQITDSMCERGAASVGNSGRCTCERGYYCSGGTNRTACDRGATTSGTGAKTHGECIFKGKVDDSTDYTKFCDSNGCIHLDADVPY